MKGALAAMLLAMRDLAEQDRVRVRLVCVPDEESEDVDARSTDALVAGGLRADFAITGEPTEMHIGVEAKGVLALRVHVAGTAAHGSTPWLGDNAILKAFDVYNRILGLRFARASTEVFERPSINLARIDGGDAFNKVPDLCSMDVDIRYLPTQDPQVIVDQIAALADVRVERGLHRAPAHVPSDNPYVVALRMAIGTRVAGDVLSVGRDGASDAISFLEAGVPAVEFGPVGGGHHGPAEWVSLSSLAMYRESLVHFVQTLPDFL
jgi:succinyl-diaminopimelate desuccinylase